MLVGEEPLRKFQGTNRVDEVNGIKCDWRKLIQKCTEEEHEEEAAGEWVLRSATSGTWAGRWPLSTHEAALHRAPAWPGWSPFHTMNGHLRGWNMVVDSSQKIHYVVDVWNWSTIAARAGSLVTWKSSMCKWLPLVHPAPCSEDTDATR